MIDPRIEEVKIVVFWEAYTCESVPQSSESWEDASGVKCLFYQKEWGWFNPVDVAR